MSAYIKLATMEYPRYEGDIRLEHPEITEAQTGAGFPCPPEYALVQWVDAPGITPPLQYLVEGKPQLVGGQWFMTWNVKERTQAEWDDMQERMKKDKLLANQTYGLEKLAFSGSPPDVIA